MILLTLKRIDLGSNYCAGDLYIDGTFFSNTLEDKDRGLHQFMKAQAIEQIKVHGITAIPYGFYEVIIDMSYHFKRLMPHILNVPGFEGVRLHGGANILHSEGCPLLGIKDTPDTLKDGIATSTIFREKLTEVLKTDRVFLSVAK